MMNDTPAIPQYSLWFQEVVYFTVGGRIGKNQIEKVERLHLSLPPLNKGNITLVASLNMSS